MRSNYKQLGQFIEPINIRNKDLAVDTLLGVSIQKCFMPSIANTVGTDMSKYKVVKRFQFAYGPVTSRNGDKISVALLEDYDAAIVSQAYVVFQIIDHEELNPEYLMMWFRRPEFDRYARFMSHGSARETFDWDEMCETELPVPPIEKQREIVKEYNTIVNRIKLNEQLNQKLEETAQALYKHWFVDFEFPNENGQPYKSSGGKMVYNEELDQEIPKGWEVMPIENVFSVKDGTHDSPKPVANGHPLVTSTHLKSFDISIENTYNISEEDYIQINKRSKVEQFDILFSMIGTVGLIHFVQAHPVNFAIKNVGLFKSSEKRELAEYVLCYLKGKNTKEYIQSSMAGSTQSYVTLTSLRNIPFLYPEINSLLVFNTKIQSLTKSIFLKAHENQLLEKSKSLLLSKMSKVESTKTEYVS
ncbi:restriction endonuclease subunit S [Candidatus Woesearchaeota archaeon]|jgi:type I restriction enzyme, S subunit|nr:restriction endonuclease subunit S [Candidatus Woesearchaeota archaeon]